MCKFENRATCLILEITHPFLVKLVFLEVLVLFIENLMLDWDRQSAPRGHSGVLLISALLPESARRIKSACKGSAEFFSLPYFCDASDTEVVKKPRRRGFFNWMFGVQQGDSLLRSERQSRTHNDRWMTQNDRVVGAGFIFRE